MEMVSMKVDNPTEGMCYPGPSDGCYPYGLRLNLNKEQLALLGYDSLPEAGTTVKIEAVGVVTRAASLDPDADGDVDYLEVEIQVTQMGIEESAASSGTDSDNDSGTRASRMYGAKQA